MNTTYPVGGFFVTTITGRVGFWVAVGQALCGRPSQFSHAGLIISSFGDTVEGQPGGARFGHIDHYRAQGRPLLIGDPVAWWAATHPGLDVQALREQVAIEGDKLRDTKYSWLDYLALALLHLHLPARWVRHRVEKSGHLICSQLVDAALRRAGIHLWHDDRLPGDVMPSDLANLAETWRATA